MTGQQTSSKTLSKLILSTTLAFGQEVFIYLIKIFFIKAILCLHKLALFWNHQYNSNLLLIWQYLHKYLDVVDCNNFYHLSDLLSDFISAIPLIPSRFFTKYKNAVQEVISSNNVIHTVLFLQSSRQQRIPICL